MRLTVYNRTTYRFSAPQRRLVQLLRMTPADSHDQTVARWAIHVDRDARLRTGRDGFGNITTMLYVEGEVDSIEVAVAGEVVTSHADGVVRGVAEPLPPALYLRATVLTPRDPAIAAWAEQVADGAERMTALHALNRVLHEQGDADPGRAPPGRDAAQAWTEKARTPRDLTHIFIAAARSIGAPARYVSGYRRGRAHEPAPYAWAEAQVDGLGWIGFDPGTGRCPEDDYVRVAVALDGAGAAPLAGSRAGEGQEELNVDVAVTAGA